MSCVCSCKTQMKIRKTFFLLSSTFWCFIVLENAAFCYLSTNSHVHRIRWVSQLRIRNVVHAQLVIRSGEYFGNFCFSFNTFSNIYLFSDVHAVMTNTVGCALWYGFLCGLLSINIGVQHHFSTPTEKNVRAIHEFFCFSVVSLICAIPTGNNSIKEQKWGE